MYPQPLQLLERTLEPVIAELVRLGILFTLGVCVALIALGVCMLTANLCAAWRAGHVAPGSRPALTDRPPEVGPLRGRMHSLRLIPSDARARTLRTSGMEDA